MGAPDDSFYPVVILRVLELALVLILAGPLVALYLGGTGHTEASTNFGSIGVNV